MIRFALPEGTSRDALDDAAADAGLVLVNIVPATDAYPAQVIYVTPDRMCAVHLVDEAAGARSSWLLRGEGADADAVEARWAEALRVALAAAEAA